MRSVTQTVKRVIIRNRRIRAIVIVTNKVVPVRDQAALAKTATESRVVVVNTGVDDAELHTLTGVPQSTQLVHLCHDMRRVCVRGCAVVSSPSQ